MTGKKLLFNILDPGNLTKDPLEPNNRLKVPFHMFRRVKPLSLSLSLTISSHQNHVQMT